jgi:hypothetical protein
LSRLYNIVGIVLVNLVVLFAVMEIVSIVVLNLHQLTVFKPVQPLAPAQQPYYTSVSWGAQYWTEFDQSHGVIYSPYVVWRRAAFQGQTIHVGPSGNRVTPGANCQPGSYRVFTFGGSTTWGTGSPDDQTMPAFLQSELSARRGGPICVVNFGETGYSSTQEVVRLMLALHWGNIPDEVVFLDGFNDVYAAYQDGQAGVHQNLGDISARFEVQSRPPPLVEWLDQSATWHLYQDIAHPAQGLATYKSMGVDTGDLAQNVLQIYAANRRLVMALGHEYGFTYDFFWQPTICASQKTIVGEEPVIVTSLDPALIELCGAIYSRAEQQTSAADHFYDLANVFDNQPQQIYIDISHVIPAGNQILARAIVDQMMG